MRTPRIATSLLTAAIALAACGGDDVAGDYCAELRTAMTTLDDGGTIADYDAALERVAAAAPTEHRPAWDLMITLSREEFDYGNFNPAMDALDEISDDLDARCTDLDWMVVDDDGRLRQAFADG